MQAIRLGVMTAQRVVELLGLPLEASPEEVGVEGASFEHEVARRLSLSFTCDDMDG